MAARGFARLGQALLCLAVLGVARLRAARQGEEAMFSIYSAHSCGGALRGGARPGLAGHRGAWRGRERQCWAGRGKARKGIARE